MLNLAVHGLLGVCLLSNFSTAVNGVDGGGTEAQRHTVPHSHRLTDLQILCSMDEPAEMRGRPTHANEVRPE